MSNSVKIIAILTARPGKAEALGTLLDSMVAPSRAEPGNLRWDVWQDQNDPGLFVLDELYTDGEAVIAHRETPHFRNYFSKINDLAERTALVLGSVHVA
ncbi:putative quinol monooxygenase [Sinorhizobium sp. BG8]|uniref:putative quinol monooxygenase n=1 Tax=Sinorhizobium sp. BG8 TaxID=2613773 RepID=UPI001AF515C9|nr:putative quinol monooxygenase [Sinorhizobium sp. BG8]QRM55493.1 antibiotic biosynthesis monooxygenase [Sinorhizobium sp. BG8]